jgi:hypothetical protein
VHPAATQNGPEAECLRNPESELMQLSESQSLDRVLESAVVVSWADLMRGAGNGLIHIDYGFAASGVVDYLQIWSSIARGNWLLACEYWMSPSILHRTGVRFENGYRSEGLAHILSTVMQHQSAFLLPEDLGRQGLLQIPTPTQEESTAAAASVHEALDHLGSSLREPALA